VPKAVFKDDDSEYAFKTSQAYAENKISDWFRNYEIPFKIIEWDFLLVLH
jgi:hypothetical protein